MDTSKNKKTLAPEAWYKFQMFTDLEVTSDGRYAAAVVSSAVEASDKFVDDLLFIEISSGKQCRVKVNGKGTRAICFSPDGSKLAWIDGDDVSHLHVLPVSTLVEAATAAEWAVGDATEAPVTVKVKAEETVDAFEHKSLGGQVQWSRDGKSLYVSVVKEEKSKTGIRVYTSPRYKADGKGLLDPVSTEIWHVTADGKSQAKVLTVDSDINSFAVSPDGAQIVYGAGHSKDAPAFFLGDLFAADTATGETKTVFEGKGMTLLPTFSPDGKHLAFLGSRDTLTADGTLTLFALEVASGKAFEVVPDFDRPTMPMGTADVKSGFPGPVFSNDGKTVRFLATDRGNAQIYEVTLPSGSPQVVSPANQPSVAQFAQAKDGTMVYAASDSTHPTELFVLEAGTTECRQLTRLNENIVEGLGLREVMQIECKSKDGWDVHGFLQLPPDETGGTGPYPMVLFIHGGPRGAHGSGFQYEVQSMASTGIAVLYVNPRGSDSYGKAFANGVINDWGNGDYNDLMAAVDAAVERGYADPERLGVTGYSYGGFMSSWVVGHTNRFKAAAPGGAVTNLVSFHGTSDIGWFWGPQEHHATVWEDMEHLWSMSPLAYVQNVTTPTLIYHSAGDDRCPIGQSEEFYAALKARGQDTTFVRYEKYSHVGMFFGPEPSIRVDMQTRVVNWFNERL